MSRSPNFASTPKTVTVSIATANTNRDGTGTLGDLYAAVETGLGARFDLIRVVATGTTTAGVVRLFYYDGTNYFLLAEILVPAVIPSVSQEVFSDEWKPSVPILVEPEHELKVSTHNAEEFDVFATGGEF